MAPIIRHEVDITVTIAKLTTHEGDEPDPKMGRTVTFDAAGLGADQVRMTMPGYNVVFRREDLATVVREFPWVEPRWHHTD